MFLNVINVENSDKRCETLKYQLHRNCSAVIVY